MSTALVLYRRWEVADPVLDCAIEIMDRMRWRWIHGAETLEVEEQYESRYVPTTTSDAMFFLWHAADHLKDIKETVQHSFCVA